MALFLGQLNPADRLLDIFNNSSLVCVDIVCIVGDLLVLALNVGRQLSQILVAVPDVYFKGL